MTLGAVLPSEAGDGLEEQDSYFIYSTIHVYHLWLGINTVIAQTIFVSNCLQFHQYTLKLSSITY